MELLNALCSFFSKEWQVPLWLLVGNHDMLRLEEGTNGLEAFAMMNPLIKVLSSPTVMEQCLMIPYEHNLDTFKATIDAHRHNPNIRAIIGHFDTIGARMNSNVVSDRGIEGSYFPVGVPVFSGVSYLI